MSHDIQAAWATAELTRMIKADSSLLFITPISSVFDAYANRESGRIWPIPDGRITSQAQSNKFEVAVEFKRTNEGLHGILTAIGQAEAYIYKGYSGSAIIIPRSYESLDNPGDYIKNVIDHTQTEIPIGVFSFEEPDLSLPSPFLSRLLCHRKINLTSYQRIRSGNFLLNEKSETQWAHVREGSTTGHAFFKYLQIAKQLDLRNLQNPVPVLNSNLILAVSRINPLADPVNYLSNAPGNNFHDIVWKTFWFQNVLTSPVSNIWINNGPPYIIDASTTNLKLKDGRNQEFFSYRSDSVKKKVIEELNSGAITELEAWEKFAQNIHNRAHSYREDIDSGLEHIGFLDSDGKPSSVGYKFVDSCERTNDCYSGQPWLLLGSAFLKNGGLGAFLHYIYKVSDLKFHNDSLAFTLIDARNHIRFNKAAYLEFLRDQLANHLNVMNTAMLRGGTVTKAFQGELAILRQFNFVSDFRL